jgi:hypothetical protein
MIKALLIMAAILLELFLIIVASGILTVISFSLLKGDFRHGNSRSTGKEKSIRVVN